MPCDECTKAEAHPLIYGLYQAGCTACEARALVQSPLGSQALKDALLGHPEAMQALMMGLWPRPTDYRVGRVESYRWAKLIEEARGK